jgi:hypothetical protein
MALPAEDRPLSNDVESLAGGIAPGEFALEALFGELKG